MHAERGVVGCFRIICLLWPVQLAPLDVAEPRHDGRIDAGVGTTGLGDVRTEF